MRHHATLLSSLLAAAIVAGCYTGGDITPISYGSITPTSTASGSEATVTGLPCDVAQILANSCASCHGSVPSGGAPNAMLTYDELVAPSVTDPTQSVAQLSVVRMQAAKSPMPPSGGVAADAAVFAAWVAGGMKPGTCDTPVVGSGANYNTPSVCTSNQTASGGGGDDNGGSTMTPGQACLGCHSRKFTAAGTVYPTAHEPDDCNGTGGAQIVITDAAGTVFTTTANSAGNFSFSNRKAPMKMPFSVKVVSGSKTRAMVGVQSNGDCNACHTEAGTQKAPGRVMAP